MDSSSVSPKSHSLFQVFLRLRPPQAGASAAADRFLTVEEPVEEDGGPTHITLNPPNDRRRAIEKFAFTRVFEEDATQLDIFHCTGVVPLVEGVLAAHGGDGTDALLATLGVTGSGKVCGKHTSWDIIDTNRLLYEVTHHPGIEDPTGPDTACPRPGFPLPWE